MHIMVNNESLVSLFYIIVDADPSQTIIFFFRYFWFLISTSVYLKPYWVNYLTCCNFSSYVFSTCSPVRTVCTTRSFEQPGSIYYFQRNVYSLIATVVCLLISVSNPYAVIITIITRSVEKLENFEISACDVI